MKLSYAREQLIREVEDGIYQCGLCGKLTLGGIALVHDHDCPFADMTVESVSLVVGPEHDVQVCGNCDADVDDCPAMNVIDSWDMLTHKRLRRLCDIYEEQTEVEVT
jgi:hypothetical protein